MDMNNDDDPPLTIAEMLERARHKMTMSNPAAANITAKPYTWTAPDKIPMRDWLYGGHLIRQFVSATVASGGIGKSSLVISETMAMLSGRPLLGVKTEQLRVWYFNLEDPTEEIARRIQAVALHFNLEPDDIGDRLFVNSGRDQPLVIAEVSERTPFICSPVVDALVEEIIDNGVDIIIVDPFVSCHKLPENDNSGIDAVVKEWGRVADRADCAVHLVHHIRKGEQEVTVESARGGGSFGDGCRSVRVVNRMTEPEAKTCGIDKPRLHFRTYIDKGNLAPPADNSDWFKLVSVDLGNNPFGGVAGDNVGVVTKWEWPNPLDGVTGRDFDAVADAIRAGHWRADSQAKSWVGIPIAKALDLSLAVKVERAKVAGLIKIWLAAGSLVEVDGVDDKRNKRKFVEVTGE